MMRIPRIGRTSAASVATAAALALLAAGGGFAFAARGGGMIHACAAKHGGALRLAPHCGRGERAVMWNVAGQTGRTGQTGRQGEQGPGATALEYRDTPNASASPTVLSTVGPFTFTEQCVTGPGTVETILSVTDSTPWHGYESQVLDDYNAGPGPQTFELSPGSSSGPSGAIADVPTYGQDDTVLTINLQLVDDNSGQLYQVPATVEADGYRLTCKVAGSVIPAS